LIAEFDGPISENYFPKLYKRDHPNAAMQLVESLIDRPHSDLAAQQRFYGRLDALCQVADPYR
jgi:hypothetical protein